MQHITPRKAMMNETNTTTTVVLAFKCPGWSPDAISQLLAWKAAMRPYAFKVLRNDPHRDDAASLLITSDNGTQHVAIADRRTWGDDVVAFSVPPDGAHWVAVDELAGGHHRCRSLGEALRWVEKRSLGDDAMSLPEGAYGEPSACRSIHPER
jgi:hypothetical protein